MATLYATRGLQGSGKTTRAKKWVAEDPIHRARVNRDDLRLMVHAGFWDGENTEKLIVRMRNQLITTALKMGQDVVCDDTNLPSRTIRELEKLAKLAKAEFVVWDMTDVPVEVCIERDARRLPTMGHVGEDVIRKRYEQFIKGRPYPLPIGAAPKDKLGDVDPYVPNPEFPEAVIVDIDGTIAHMAGRSPYDETRVHEDTPNQPVIDMIERLANGGMKIIFCSGRTDKCYIETRAWIRTHVKISDDYALFMRKAGDTRKDNVVKREIFDTYLRNAGVNIVGVFDDRNQVVQMWRDELGLTVYQVADGNF